MPKYVCIPGESAVENGVAAGWAHSKDMKTKEGEVVVGPAVKRNLKVFKQVDQVQRKPAYGEDNQHGQE